MQDFCPRLSLSYVYAELFRFSIFPAQMQCARTDELMKTVSLCILSWNDRIPFASDQNLCNGKFITQNFKFTDCFRYSGLVMVALILSLGIYTLATIRVVPSHGVNLIAHTLLLATGTFVTLPAIDLLYNIAVPPWGRPMRIDLSLSTPDFSTYK